MSIPEADIPARDLAAANGMHCHSLAITEMRYLATAGTSTLNGISNQDIGTFTITVPNGNVMLGLPSGLYVIRGYRAIGVGNLFQEAIGIDSGIRYTRTRNGGNWAFNDLFTQDNIGLSQLDVDRRVRAGVEDWAEAGNLSAIPASKLANAGAGGIGRRWADWTFLESFGPLLGVRNIGSPPSDFDELSIGFKTPGYAFVNFPRIYFGNALSTNGGSYSVQTTAPIELNVPGAGLFRFTLSLRIRPTLSVINFTAAPQSIRVDAYYR